ncbi:LrgB family protein [Uliginosibacterium sp. H1]|uniref:LrgB family protein n=1 Tax=Uliginosibacterium sp. H1 TaxID=3114757 RepID=UPI002E175749|nr:LrgB family protein [Uliginosibacterium sp. H1]
MTPVLPDPLNASLAALWVYLDASPLTWLMLTLAAFIFGGLVSERFCHHPAANPVAISVVLLVSVLFATGTPYARYFEGAQFIHFALGPATVALGLPLYQQRHVLRRHALPLAAGLLVGSFAAAGSAVLIGWMLGASAETLLSLIPKSVTTPIAMGVSEHVGGLPSLTVVLVILTGILGAMLANPIHAALGIHHPVARGFSMGVTAHGIGTARAFQEREIMGAFAGLAIGLNGALTAMAVPWLVHHFHR